MSKKNKSKKINDKNVQKVLEEGQPEKRQPEKSNTLILGGILLAMSSIGLLIFVLSDKVLHLS